jgi:predicted negative regulator of RcsB-dependent stress response
MPDRRIDLESRSRIEQLEIRYRTHAMRTWVAIVGLYVAAGFGIWQNHVASEKIQTSRVTSLRQSCQESNDRHDRTVAAFVREFARASEGLSGTELARAKASRDANVRLIDVFIPVHKDRAGRSTCPQYAEDRATP